MSRFNFNSFKRIAHTGTLKVIRRINPSRHGYPDNEELSGYYYDDPAVGKEFLFMHAGNKARYTTPVQAIQQPPIGGNGCIQFRTLNTIYQLKKDTGSQKNGRK